MLLARPTSFPPAHPTLHDLARTSSRRTTLLLTLRSREPSLRLSLFETPSALGDLCRPALTPFPPLLPTPSSANQQARMFSEGPSRNESEMFDPTFTLSSNSRRAQARPPLGPTRLSTSSSSFRNPSQSSAAGAHRGSKASSQNEDLMLERRFGLRNEFGSRSFGQLVRLHSPPHPLRPLSLLPTLTNPSNPSQETFSFALTSTHFLLLLWRIWGLGDTKTVRSSRRTTENPLFLRSPLGSHLRLLLRGDHPRHSAAPWGTG